MDQPQTPSDSDFVVDASPGDPVCEEETFVYTEEMWRSDLRSGFWLHGMFLVLASIIILMSVLMSSQGQTRVFLPGSAVPMPETCTSKMLFGRDCPGCGLTRAFISISHGQFARAWHFNPASYLVYPFIAMQIPYNGWQLYRIMRKRLPWRGRWTIALPIVVACGLLMQWLIRMFA